MSAHKISTWVEYILIALAVVSTIVFYGIGFQDTAPGPDYTDQFLGLTYLLVGLGLGVTLLLSVINFVKKVIAEPKSALKSLSGPVFIILIFVVAYAMSDGTPLKLQGYTGTDNVPSMLKFADTFLFSMYALIVIALIMTIGSSIMKLFK
ncbi:hypothetical protein ACE1ET_12605 [Saccharicrinis sp. FJH62]|uniref:hypothetical protein n=1 Tax=Saccharicrinis sp. FJH62 TaxID=3344657 RepID=UPI0035D4984B